MRNRSIGTLPLWRRGRLVFGVAVVGAAFAASMACSSSDDDSDASAGTATATTTGTPAAGGTLTNADGWPRVEGMRGDRYCEVLLASVVDGHLNAKVWNTYTLNECPDAQWKALDAAAIKTERGVLAALLNGPRYWLMDAIEKKPTGPREESMFGELEMFLAATVDLGPIPPNLARYTERRVARETVFEFAKGGTVFELTDPTGRVFVMQSYSQQDDPALTEADLASLSTRLKPPEGWVFGSRTLEDTLRVLAPNGDAVVIQDDLNNTYQLIASN